MKNTLDQFDSSFLLAMKYKLPVVTLETVVADFMPYLKIETAKKRASKQDLPFPAFKAEQNSKAGWLVKITDVAIWLDSEHAISAKDWNNMKSSQRD